MAARMNSDAAGGTGWSPPRGLGQGVPRRVRLRAGVRHGLMGLLGGVLTVVAMIGLVAVLASHRTSLLLAHGVLGQGVVQALNESHGKGDSYSVQYGFTVPRPPSPAEAVQVGHDVVSEPQFRRLVIGSPVSVLYLPQRPDISILHVAMIPAPPGQPTHPLELLVDLVALLVPLVTAGLLFAVPYRRQRRLLEWGSPSRRRSCLYGR